MNYIPVCADLCEGSSMSISSSLASPALRFSEWSSISLYAVDCLRDVPGSVSALGGLSLLLLSLDGGVALGIVKGKLDRDCGFTPSLLKPGKLTLNEFVVSVGNCFCRRARKSSSASWDMELGVCEMSQKGIAPENWSMV